VGCVACSIGVQRARSSQGAPQLRVRADREALWAASGRGTVIVAVRSTRSLERAQIVSLHSTANDSKANDRLAPANDPVIRSVGGIAHSGPADATAEPPWPQLPQGGEIHWERFLRYLSPFEAQIVAGRLNAEGVPTIVVSALPVDFSSNAEILVPRYLIHRARWVLAWPPVTEEELLFLSTGEIGPMDEGGGNGPL
jgi:hypothetical protein